MLKKDLIFKPKFRQRGNYRASGAISFRPSRGENRNPTYSFSIQSKQDLNTIICFFENSNLIQLQGHKFSQFQNWKNSIRN